MQIPQVLLSTDHIALLVAFFAGIATAVFESQHIVPPHYGGLVGIAICMVITSPTQLGAEDPAALQNDQMDPLM